MLDQDERCYAILDEAREYRYLLGRRLGPGTRKVVFVMLNPSTADERDDDPTIRRCIGFARTWGYDFLEVVNLFALRSTDPAQLRQHPDPVGPDADRYLRKAAESADMVIAAWGNHGNLRGRDAEVVRLLKGSADLHALAVTKNHSPRHPLYIQGTAIPVPYEGRMETRHV